MVVKQKTVDELKQELLDKIRVAIQEIWPSSDAPIQDFDVIFGTASNAIDVHYQAAKELGDIPINMVLQSLRTKLGMPDLTLKAERIRTGTAAKDSGQAPEQTKIGQMQSPLVKRLA